MNFIKNNKKQLLTLLVLLVIFAFTRFFGSDTSDYYEDNASVATGIVEDNKTETESETEIEAETKSEAEAEPDTESEVIPESAEVSEQVDESAPATDEVDITYEFRNKTLWIEHFEKHGEEFPYETKEEYLMGANIMLSNPNKLHKLEKEDGDDVYYLEETNEFIIVSKDGYLRTYFKPSKGKKYFDKQ